MQLTYDEIIENLELEDIPSKRKGYSLNPGIDEITYIKKSLTFFLPDNVKVTITIADIRLKSSSNNNHTLLCTKKSFFFHTISSFKQSHSGELSDIEGFFQLILGSCKSDKPIIITGVVKIHLKCDCVNL